MHTGLCMFHLECGTVGFWSMFPPSSERQYCQKQKDLYFLKGGTFCLWACRNSCCGLFPDHPAPCTVYLCGNGACWSWPSLKICAKILAVKLIQTPVVELLTPVTAAALPLQFASPGSTVSCCSRGRQGGSAAGSVYVRQVLVPSQRKDGQFSGFLHPQMALSGRGDEKWASGQEWWDNPGAGHQTSQTFMWASFCTRKTNRQKFILCIFSSCLVVVRGQFREGAAFLYPSPSFQSSLPWL